MAVLINIKSYLMAIKLTGQPLMAMSLLFIGYGFHELAINCNEMVVVGGVVGAMGREHRFRIPQTRAIFCPTAPPHC